LVVFRSVVSLLGEICRGSSIIWFLCVEMQQGVGCFIYYFSLLCSLVRLEQLVLKVEVVEGGRKWRRGGRSWKLEKTGTGDVKGT
jgi:hypothetical protein